MCLTHILNIERAVAGLSCLRERVMPLVRDKKKEEPTYLSEVKRLSGQRIEQERRRRGLSQAVMGSRIGVGTTWVRHIESGYPKVRLDDHFLCDDFLSISPLAIFLPLLFLIHGREFPAHLLLGNLKHLERAILDCVVNWHLNNLRGLLRQPAEQNPQQPEDDASADDPTGSMGVAPDLG